MMKRSAATLLLGLGLAAAAPSAQAALDIQLDFTNFINNAPANASANILNGASINDAIGVINHAAAIWEDAFKNSSSSLSWANAGNLTQTINVGWNSYSGSTLARGGATWPSGGSQWLSGSLIWDNDGSSTFYIDTTPGDSSEWQQSSTRSLSLGGVNVNVERVSYDGKTQVVRDNSDMLTVAIHEIAHALGFLGTYPLYNAADLGGDDDIDITSGPFNGAQIPIHGGHTEIDIERPGNDAKGTGRSDFPYDPGTNSWFPNDPGETYEPNVMAPAAFTGVRHGLTEADILIVAEYLAFDMSNVNFNPVPEPSSLALLGAAGLLFFRRRRG